MIHSPLVGPLTLTPLATELRDRGFEVAVPDLRSALAADRPQWQAILELAIAIVGADIIDVIVGHSGAGVMLPLLAERLRPQVVAFVDAVVPGEGSQYEASPEFVAFIDSLERSGALLPPWYSWWGEKTMTRLIPDEELRRRIVADTPRVPRSLYEDAVPLPAGWTKRRWSCFLQMSPAYEDDSARAKMYGWPTAQLSGQHLDVAVKPADVAILLVELIDRVRSQSDR